MAEMDTNQVLRTHTWGLDLSGSLSGAGGVGGLLFSSNELGTFSTGYDGNGNVVLMNDMAGVLPPTKYEYSPFGRILLALGPLIDFNPYRFSSKYSDDEAHFSYYGLRYYNPDTGRWLSQDPISERGGLNLYGFVGNDGVNRIDVLGLYKISMIFNAFISGRRGVWLDEPMGGMRPGDVLSVYRTTQRQFRTDMRDFGEFSESKANARLFSIAEIDSSMIGKAKTVGDLIRGFSRTGVSDQRTRHRDAIFGSGSAGVGAPPPILGYEWSDWVARSESATVDDSFVEVQSPDKCTTTITFKPEASYPFVSVFGINPSPEIDYEITFTLTKRTDVAAKSSPITVILSGVHDAFPDYESYVQNSSIYDNYSNYSGPGFMSLSGLGNRVTIPDNTGVSLLGK